MAIPQIPRAPQGSPNADSLPPLPQGTTQIYTLAIKNLFKKPELETPVLFKAEQLDPKFLKLVSNYQEINKELINNIKAIEKIKALFSPTWEDACKKRDLLTAQMALREAQSLVKWKILKWEEPRTIKEPEGILSSPKTDEVVLSAFKNIESLPPFSKDDYKHIFKKLFGSSDLNRWQETVPRPKSILNDLYPVMVYKNATGTPAFVLVQNDTERLLVEHLFKNNQGDWEIQSLLYCKVPQENQQGVTYQGTVYKDPKDTILRRTDPKDPHPSHLSFGGVVDKTKLDRLITWVEIASPEAAMRKNPLN